MLKFMEPFRLACLSRGERHIRDNPRLGSGECGCQVYDMG